MTGRPRARGSSGRPRPRASRERSLVGREYDVTVGAPAHGGHCVARLPAELDEVGGTVVFVRHSLPGEEVRIRVTEGAVGDRFLRADAVEVRQPAPGRVEPPCPHARPGGCGGCDLQHVALEEQRRLKEAVVAEQLRRIAGLDLSVPVESVAADADREDGLGWRTRMRYHRSEDGRLGLRAHRSSRVVPVGVCPLEAPGAVRVVQERDGTRSVSEPAAGPGAGQDVVEVVRGRSFRVAPEGFWQVHRDAPAALVAAVLEAARVRPGDRVLDLFSGVGLLSAFLAEGVGPGGEVDAVEGDAGAAARAAGNLADLPWARSLHAPVESALAPDGPLAAAYDVVVLDPPRVGARREVVAGVVARAPRTVVHVACDPAAFARDVALFADHGYTLEGARGLDLFPMTHHVECVALLTKTGSDLR